MPQAEFDPVEFAGKIGHLQGTLDALVGSVERYHKDDTKQFDEIYDRLRKLETQMTAHLESRSSNGNGRKTKMIYSGGTAAVIGFLELLRHWLSE